MAEIINSFSQVVKHKLGSLQYILNVEYGSVFLLWLFTISSLIGISLGYTDWFISKTPINLMLGFLLVLINVPFGTSYGKVIFVFTFLFGMILEVIGVFTGDIFGTYYYGDNLGFKLFDVPLMIGIYWAVLTTVTSQMARVFFNNMFLVAIFGASLMVGLDVFIEQMAHVFDFWHFEGDIAPFQNYTAWFIAAFFLHLLTFKFMPKGGSRFATHLYFNQIIFFAVTYLIIHLW